uniref:Marine proteobacterial sortase target protein n=1 Tax=uncultured bacterium CSLF43 TaxID=1091575 RepID=G4WW08_9BACT|nr:marine proteobacterial sortase target protein [uncultured bacterium CSLF43]
MKPFPMLAMAALAAGVFLPGPITSARAAHPGVRTTPPDSITEGALIRIDPKSDLAELCPLKHTDVKAEISGFVARVQVTQEFVNPAKEKIEAVYKFPLPPGSAVDSMTMLVGDHKIIGKIKRREEARKIYDDARSRGQTASLLDQERPNIFTQSIANIAPGQAVKIVIGYVEPLKYEDAAFEFTFPMVVGPRYIPNGLPDADRVVPRRTPEGTRAGHDLSLQVSLDAAMPLSALESPTHVVDVARPDARRALVKLKDQATIPNKDFVLRYAVASTQIQDAIVAHSDKRGGYFMLVLQPPARIAPAEITPKEIVFVLDTSGSMMGFPIEKAKEAMKLAMDDLNPRDTFNLITFSGDEHILFPKPVPATPENVREAQKFLMSREGRGGTEMMKAIKAALDPSDDQKHIRVACFMTDGEVGNDFEILHAVQQHPNARVFAFGIGSSVNHFLLDNMARQGRGEVEYVGLNDDGSAAAKRFHERVRTPVLTDVSIDWGSLPVSEVYPKRIPDLFSAKPVVVLGRYSGSANGSIRLRGKVAGRDFDRVITVSLPAGEGAHDVAPVLWARSKVDDLMNRDLRGAQTGQQEPEIRNAVTQLGLDYAIMTQYTSFVAVEETMVTEPGKEPRRIEVPVEMPEGVSYEGVYGRDSAVAVSRAAMPMMARRQFAGGFTGGVVGGVPPAMEAPMAPAPPPPPLAPQAWKVSPALRGLAGKMLVQIYVTDTSDATLKKLRGLGVEIAARPQSGRIVVGKVDAARLDEIAKLAEVRFIAPQP